MSKSFRFVIPEYIFYIISDCFRSMFMYSVFADKHGI